ncbi:hypothetical protein ACLB1T_22240 [Escherichia coli]
MGKTVASCALLQAAKAVGYRTAGYKPGCLWQRSTRKAYVIVTRWRYSTTAACSWITELNPYTFAEPTSPHIISAQEGRPIESLVMSAGSRALEQTG